MGPTTTVMTGPSPLAERVTSDVTSEAPHVAHDDSIVCRRCRAALTRSPLSVVRDGAHQHTFRNPAGYSWTVRCFSDAPGCGAAGTPTGEATWFADHDWCFAVCTGCGEHVGWWYVGHDSSFIGLIATRIAGG